MQRTTPRLDVLKPNRTDFDYFPPTFLLRLALRARFTYLYMRRSTRRVAPAVISSPTRGSVTGTELDFSHYAA
jgi:hypothetical protein